MKFLRIGIIGIGHIFDYYLSAIKRNRSIFQISGIYDKKEIVDKNYRNIPICSSMEELLSTKPDIIAILTPSSSRYEIAKKILLKGIPVILEKPQTETIQQYDDLVNLSVKNKTFIFGAFHSRYTSTHMFVRNRLNITKKGTFHQNFGKLQKIELNRFDPYICQTKKGKLQLKEHLPEKTSGLDSWPNILAELALFVDKYNILEVLNLSDFFLPENIEVKSEIRGNFSGGGTFIGRTDWTQGISRKTTILKFAQDITIIMEHTYQKVFIQIGARKKKIADFSDIGKRMDWEYFCMF